MKGPAPPHSLSRREREIMDILYRRGRATVAEVMSELSGTPAYSTVRAQLRVLEEKGHMRHAAQQLPGGRIDLGEQKPESVAAELEMTANNLRVRHHRAREQLRKRLEETCRLCAKHGCLDCDCAKVPASKPAR